MHIKTRENGTIPAITVIHTVDGILDSCDSYPDDAEGNELAEKKFKLKVHTHCGAVIEEDMLTCLEEGYCEYGNHYVFITHS